VSAVTHEPASRKKSVNQTKGNFTIKKAEYKLEIPVYFRISNSNTQINSTLITKTTMETAEEGDTTNHESTDASHLILICQLKLDHSMANQHDI
jgi:hypothetical protein